NGRRRKYGADRFPGTLLYQLLLSAGGADESGPAVAEAVSLEPTTVLELVAFLLEATRRGHALHPPSVPSIDVGGEDTAEEAPTPPPSAVRPTSTDAEIHLSDLHLDSR